MAVLNQGKKFLMYGIFNFIITNVILQLLLLFLNVWSSAIISQIINNLLGFKLYSRYVFKVNNYRNSIFIKYILFALFSYILCAKSIIIISDYYLISRNLAAFILVPFLTTYSFLSQKYLVFKK